MYAFKWQGGVVIGFLQSNQRVEGLDLTIAIAILHFVNDLMYVSNHVIIVILKLLCNRTLTFTPMSLQNINQALFN